MYYHARAVSLWRCAARNPTPNCEASHVGTFLIIERRSTWRSPLGNGIHFPVSYLGVCAYRYTKTVICVSLLGCGGTIYGYMKNTRSDAIMARADQQLLPSYIRKTCFRMSRAHQHIRYAYYAPQLPHWWCGCCWAKKLRPTSRRGLRLGQCL